MSGLVHSLRALVEVDVKRRKVEEQIHVGEKQLQDITDLFTKASRGRDAAAAALIQAKKQVDRLELDAKSLRADEDTKRAVLNKATSTEICEALQKELGTLRGKQRQLEGELVKSWHGLDLAKKVMQDAEAEQQKRGHQYEGDVAKLGAELTTLSGELKALNEMRESMIKALPAEWQSRYVAMQRMVPDPIVPVVSGLCSSCFYQIIARDIALLKKQEILECKSCYRLLYQEPEDTGS